MVDVNEPISFFGREDALTLLNKRIKDFKEGYRQNIALIGEELSGKTSLIQRFIKNTHEDEIVFAYLKVIAFEHSYFLRNFLRTILYTFLKTKVFLKGDDLEYLTSVMETSMPTVVEFVRKIRINIDKGKITEAYREIIDLPDILTRETGKFCVIIFDNFHNLEELKIANPYQELGKKIMSQRKCMYIVASSSIQKTKEILNEKLSLLFGNFETIEVGSFSVQESLRFIDVELEGFQIDESYKKFLVDFTSGYPFYLKIICEKLKNTLEANNVRGLSLGLLISCLEELLFCKWGILNQYFSNYLKRISTGRNDYTFISILLSMVDGNNKIKEISSSLHKKKEDVSLKINRLHEQNLLSRNGSFYYISCKIFKFWIKHVFQYRLSSINLESQHQLNAFRNSVRCVIDNFIQADKVDSFERIIELFNLFHNESVQLNGHKYRLTNLKEFKAFTIDEDKQCAMAHSMNTLWFILLKENEFVEDDVLKLLDECRRHKGKPQRRIIISFGDIDVNAKLRALGEKIWVWGKRDVNALLNIYNKPFIIK
ncbi:ATP-binding protein [Candidatus Omnitrophota bacterium]